MYLTQDLTFNKSVICSSPRPCKNISRSPNAVYELYIFIEMLISEQTVSAQS